MKLRLSDEQISARLDMLERQIAETRDWKTLAHLNQLFQMLINEQVARDLEAAEDHEREYRE